MIKIIKIEILKYLQINFIKVYYQILYNKNKIIQINKIVNQISIS